MLKLFRCLFIFINLFVMAIVNANNNVCLDTHDEACLSGYENSQNSEEDAGSESESNNALSLPYLDISHSVVSNGLKSLATNLDEFFSNETTDYHSSGSYIRVNLYAVFEEAGKISRPSNLDLKLRLPITEKKLNFVFETDSAQLADDSAQTLKNNVTAEAEEKEYVAGVQAVFKKKEHWRFRTVSGARLTSKLEPFVRLNMDWNDSFGKWDLHWNETPYWSNSSGWELGSLFEFDRQITDKVLFRSSSSANWTAALDYFDVSEVLSVFHTLTDKSAVIYQAGVYGISEPKILTTSYLLSIHYRKNIYKDYLFLDVTPQISYPKTNGFHPQHSLTFKIEVLFEG